MKITPAWRAECGVAGRVRPAGGVLLRSQGLVVHGFAEPSPLRGWLVVTSKRHVRG